MRRLASALLLLLAGCPEQSGLQCPPNTSIVGQYSLTFTANHDAGECVANPADAGPIKLTLDDAGVKGSTLCVGTAADGGPQLQLLIPGKGGARKSDLLDDGGFHFVSDTVVAQNTACVCDVNDSETFDGYLLTGAPFALRPDGGLPSVTGIAATLTDNVAVSGSSSGCLCALPCTVSYSISGSPF
jgi:hypothetical protein